MDSNGAIFISNTLDPEEGMITIIRGPHNHTRTFGLKQLANLVELSELEEAGDICNEEYCSVQLHEFQNEKICLFCGEELPNKFYRVLISESKSTEKVFFNIHQKCLGKIQNKAQEIIDNNPEYFVAHMV